MVRKRVLSFMSHFSGDHKRSSSYNASTTTTPSTSSPANASGKASFSPYPNTNSRHSVADLRTIQTPTGLPTPSLSDPSSPAWDSREQSPSAEPPNAATTRRSRGRSNSRPLSMVMTYQPPTMEVSEDTIPELQPIFGFLNSHGNKLYQEGYFLKLDDQNTQGKPNPDRTWTECFAQLVGTVLSLWDAAELDAAGEDGEVLPKFINLTDASIKMIESLPTSSAGEQPLQNILSISTAGKNRYLLHFNSKHSLIQWTAGIRLAMFEHATLQEAYTGALLAGKGKLLNNIGVIMERARFPVEQWVRVRFGAGMPWRRCWCVIAPPDEKEYQKAQKEVKKKGPYDRTRMPVLKGDIKFYDQRKEGKKQKKLQPIATMVDAYSAYALYPQAKSLIDASTLIKLEGTIMIHADPPSQSEGFVFVMPEVNPAISGFEMMMRFLFPTWDTFGMYGRPGRLVTSVLDQRSLMFAMPKGKRYGYLEMLDVSSLILTDGSGAWAEQEWRKKLKELTSTRMSVAGEERDLESGPSSRSNSRAGSRLSGGTPGPGGRPRVGFAETPEPPSMNRASRSMSLNSRPPDFAPGQTGERAPSALAGSRHSRNASDPSLMAPLPHHPAPHQPSPLSNRGPTTNHGFNQDLASTPERMSSEDEQQQPFQPPPVQQTAQNMSTPEPVIRPPRFSHLPGEKPSNRPYHSPEMRRANSRLSSTTLAQLAQNGAVAGGAPADGEMPPAPPPHRDQAGLSPVQPPMNQAGMPANHGPQGPQGMNNPPRSPAFPPPGAGFQQPQQQRSQSPFNPHRGPPNPDYRRPSPGPGGNSRDRSDSRPSTASSQGRPMTPNGGGPGGPSGPGGPYPGRGGMRGPPPGYRGRGGPGPGPGPGRGRGMPVGPPMGPPGHPNMPPPGQNRRGPPGQEPLQVNTVMARKPVMNGNIPARGDSLGSRSPRVASPPPAGSMPPQSSASSFTSASINSSIMNKIQGPPPGEPRGAMRRHDTMHSQASSHYDDTASTESPDYASTRPSIDTQVSVERPRAGVLKTVGQAESDEAPRREFDMPEINFGPTTNYAVPARTKTPTGVNPGPPVPRHGGQPPPSPGGLQTFAPALGPQRRSPGPQAVGAPAPSHDRQASNESARRSMIWQPPSAGGHAVSPGAGGMSAEQFVQSRAASNTPQYAHQRQSSQNTLTGYRAGSATPPLHRAQGSQDYIGIAHSRNNSQELLQRPSSRSAGDLLQRPASRELLHRPGSRGAGAVLGGQGAQGEAAHLSAREQEQVARATGSPLISMAAGKNGPPASGGLVGAIQTREREREQAKQGWQNQSTQQAIQQRQQAQQSQMQAQQAAQFAHQQAQLQAQLNAQQQQMMQQYGQAPGTPRGGPPPMNGYRGMGYGPGGGVPPSPMRAPQSYFEQEGQFGGSSPARAMSPQLQQPLMQVAHHQAQFVPGPQQGQQQGQGGYGGGYHGQAF